jgi:hypothetical protein
VSRYQAPDRYDPARHDAQGFSSGVDAPDRYLQRVAARHRAAAHARVYVVTVDDDRKVVASTPLSAGSVNFTDATSRP